MHTRTPDAISYTHEAHMHRGPRGWTFTAHTALTRVDCPRFPRRHTRRAQKAAHCRAQLKAELLIAPLITGWLQAGGAQSSQQRQSQQPSKTATTATCGERL